MTAKTKERLLSTALRTSTYDARLTSINPCSARASFCLVTAVQTTSSDPMAVLTPPCTEPWPATVCLMQTKRQTLARGLSSCRQKPPQQAPLPPQVTSQVRLPASKRAGSHHHPGR